MSFTYVGRARWNPSRQQLMAFEGEYRSDELGVTYRLKLEGDSLTYNLRPGVKRALRPSHNDAFALGGATVWFSRDRGGKVVAMHLSEGRMWDLVIPRLR